MRPAFDSTKQVAAFALLLLLLLAGPWLAGKSFLPEREQIYSSTSWQFGSYPFLDQHIFHEQGDIDIAFMGSSHAWYGINTPVLQKELSRQTGREATVLTLCWFWPGNDALYFIVKDLLAHRRVKMLVFCDEQPDDTSRPQGLAKCWYRFGDGAEDIAGLPLPDRASYYASAMLGLPRNLLSLMRTNLPLDANTLQEDFYMAHYRAANPATRLGSLAIPYDVDTPAHFERFQPVTGATPADVCVYSPQNRTSFVFKGPSVKPRQLYFLRKLVALAQQHGVRLVMLHVPSMNEVNSTQIPERACWPDWLSADVRLVGVPGAKLFAGMSDREKRLLFCDPNHLNINGQEYFTPVITPTLIQLFENETNH